MEIIITLIIAAAVIGAVVVVYLLAKRRREALAALAQRLGLAFHPDHDRELPVRLDFLDQLDRGTSRYAYNRLSGLYEGHEIMAFDYHYKTGSGKHAQHHYLSVLTLLLPRPVPELLISPEGFLSKIAQSLGYDDIDLESAEFSGAFCVRSRDKKFAYDVCHPLMMEYLLAHRELALEFDGNVLALFFDAQLDVTAIEPRLRQLVAIRRLLPDYLFPKT